MSEEQICRLLEVLETRGLITRYDSDYVQEKLSLSDWMDFCRKEGEQE